MCGIAGIVGVRAEDRRERVRSMRELIAHRGPDAAGEHHAPNAALAIQRLRIIDLRTGDQPQTNETGSLWTVFNGEIYNFRELRASLAARGHRLATSSDTEVIVHLYEDHGERFVEKLEGMFAIALWDEASRRLILARDRIGKKPLLYWERDGELLFSSEHRSLLAGIASRPPVDPDAIRAYLRLGYVPAPLDAFSGVRKLLPAHYLVWEAGASRVERYWAPPPSGTSILSDDDAATELRRILERSVERRLVSDVPLGAFLSGGVDSSAVVATMARLSARVKTFSIGFEDETYSELPHARRIAERFGTEHHEFVVRPLEAGIVPLLVRHYGEPYADSSAIPTYHLSRVTRGHVTVALAGDGGDELFAGYDRYRAALLASRLDRIPRPLRQLTFGSAARVLARSSSPKTLANRALRYARVAVLEPTARYLAWAGIFDPLQLGVLLDPAFAERTRAADRELESDGHRFGDDPVSAAQLLDLRLYLPDDLLVKVDIASMANSLEVRAPFLDREMVEFAISLPARMKLRGATSKYVLKRAFEGIVPPENMHRPKMGFSIPLASWLRGELRELTVDATMSPRARGRGYFRPEAVRRLVAEHLSGRADHAARIWALVMLELWHRELVDA
jgi:asparagine synthase (glutamine-hydrolysing)